MPTPALSGHSGPPGDTTPQHRPPPHTAPSRHRALGQSLLTEALLGVSSVLGCQGHPDSAARTRSPPTPTEKYPRLEHVRPSGPRSAVTPSDRLAPSLHICRVYQSPLLCNKLPRAGLRKTAPLLPRGSGSVGGCVPAPSAVVRIRSHVRATVPAASDLPPSASPAPSSQAQAPGSAFNAGSSPHASNLSDLLCSSFPLRSPEARSPDP